MPQSLWDRKSDTRSPNDAPAALADVFDLDEDDPLGVPMPGVLGNDSDIDGDALTVVLVTPPRHGAVALAANGSFTYTPSADYNGTDSFIYRVRDPDLANDLGTVTFTVRNDTDEDRYIVTEGGYSGTSCSPYGFEKIGDEETEFIYLRPPLDCGICLSLPAHCDGAMKGVDQMALVAPGESTELVWDARAVVACLAPHPDCPLRGRGQGNPLPLWRIASSWKFSVQRRLGGNQGLQARCLLRLRHAGRAR